MNQHTLEKLGHIIETELGSYVEKYGRILSDRFDLVPYDGDEKLKLTFSYWEHGTSGREWANHVFVVPSNTKELKKELDTVKAWLKLRWDDPRR